MNKNILLSIVTANKNDEYYEDQLQRTKFILNYYSFLLKKINAVSKIEYIIVDWGSDNFFSDYFYKEISMCPAFKFINIPKNEVKKCELDFDISEALNVGIKNSLGKHIMVSTPDSFFPLSVFNNLINFLESPELYGIKGNEYKLVPRKFLDDDFIIYESDMKLVDQYLCSLNHSAFQYPKFPINSGGGTGGNLLKKKQWLQIGGIKKTVKYNRGQDLINLHNTSKICSHIDTSTFGFYLLKLPRTKFGSRKIQIEKGIIHNKNLTFDKNENIINQNKINIIKSTNLPKKKNGLNIKKSSFESKEPITFKEIIQTIFDCISLINLQIMSLISKDIQFILNMKTTIKKKKLKIIILDETQAARFINCLARTFQDLKFIILMNPITNNSMSIINFRTNLTYTMLRINPNYYGHLKVLEFKEDILKSINKLKSICIIQDHSTDNFLNFQNEFSSTKVNTIRKLTSNTKSIDYEIEGDFATRQKNRKILTSNIFLNFITFGLVALFKVKRFLGALKRSL